MRCSAVHALGKLLFIARQQEKAKDWTAEVNACITAARLCVKGENATRGQIIIINTKMESKDGRRGRTEQSRSAVAFDSNCVVMCLSPRIDQSRVNYETSSLSLLDADDNSNQQLYTPFSLSPSPPLSILPPLPSFPPSLYPHLESHCIPRV